MMPPYLDRSLARRTDTLLELLARRLGYQGGWYDSVGVAWLAGDDGRVVRLRDVEAARPAELPDAAKSDSQEGANRGDQSTR